MRIFVYVLGILLVLLVGPVSAQQSIIDEQSRQIQLEEQRRLELERQQRDRMEQPPAGQTFQLPKLDDVKVDAKCVQVKEISLVGGDLLDQDKIRRIISQYENRCLTLVDINNLLREMTNLYMEEGYVTSRAYLPEQNMLSGNLQINVLEGRIEDIKFKDSSYKERLLKGAFPNLIGSVLNLRDIEQGLDQLNRLPSNDVTMNLVPGEESGSSIVVVENKLSRTWRASVGQDNSGQETTGQQQLLFSFSKDNLTDFNDQFSFYYNIDMEAVDLGKNPRSESINLFYSVPYGYWTFSGSASQYCYRYNLQSGSMSYTSSGKSTTEVINIDRVFYRDSDSKSSLGLSVTHRDIQNYIDETKLKASSLTLSSLGASLSHSTRAFGGVFNAQCKYSRGVPIFGAREDQTDLNVSTPRKEFNKISFSSGYYRPFKLENLDMSWSSKVNGQWAPHTLYSAERMSIGSRYTVRGFHKESLSGDIGGYARNELVMDLPLNKYPTASKYLGKMQLYAGYDFGFIHADREDDYERGTLQGAVIGTRFSGGDFSLDCSVSRPIQAPEFINDDDLVMYTSFNYAF